MLTEIENNIRAFALHNSKIRAVVLNGSRANPNVKADSLQDFDLTFIVEDFQSFLEKQRLAFAFRHPCTTTNPR